MKNENYDDINLAFLRKAAHDEITTRSMEIPACGGFMLAERAPRRIWKLSTKAKDAEFFADAAELLHKCRHYLAHPEQAQQIAAQSGALPARWLWQSGADAAYAGLGGKLISSRYVTMKINQRSCAVCTSVLSAPSVLDAVVMMLAAVLRPPVVNSSFRV